MTQNTENSVWADDILGRKDVADRLTKYLTERYIARPGEPGFVLAINADWGFGKSFLLEKWRADLTAAGYPAVYFDAWQNDFTPEPLVAFIAEIQSSLKPVVAKVPGALRLFDQAIEKAKNLFKPTASIFMQLVAKKVTGFTVDQIESMIEESESIQESEASDPATDAVGEAPDVEDRPADAHRTAADRAEAVKALKKVFDRSLEEHTDKASAIKAFRKSLALLIRQLQEATDTNLPMFFFVDELDRCRPDYAIELLEGIKHLFGVPGVYFVVATNLRQLGVSTKAIYGSEFEGHRYLKRFFDLEFRLPEPDHLKFAEYLFSTAALSPELTLFTGLTDRNSDAKGDGAMIVFSQYGEFLGLGLRDLQQVMKMIEAATVGLRHVHVHWLFFLAMLYHQDQSAFDKVVESKGQLSRSDFGQALGGVKTKTISVKSTSRSRDPYSQNADFKFTPLIDIAWQYYSLAWKNAVNLRGDRDPNSIEFPDILIWRLIQEAPPHYERGKHYDTSVASYPDLVRYAGQFS